MSEKKSEYQPIARWTAKAALFTVNDQMCKLWAATTPSMLSSDTLTLLYLMFLGVPSHKRQDGAINFWALEHVPPMEQAESTWIRTRKTELMTLSKKIKQWLAELLRIL